MKLGYFVTGTDTGVGKTLIASAILYQLGRLGWLTAGMKPIAAGCVESPSGLVNEDVEFLRRAATIDLCAEEICPYLLPAAVAPHIAATESGVYIDPLIIRARLDQLMQRADAVIVEGIGGFQVPLSERYDTADLAAMIGLPVILVVGLRLGCLNHALLTADAVRSRGLPLAGWVANLIDPYMERVDQNIETLTHRLPCPLLGTVPFQHQLEASHIELKLPL